MRSLPEASREEPSSVTEIVTAGLAIIGFIVCSVVLAKVAYPVVALILHGAKYAVVGLISKRSCLSDFSSTTQSGQSRSGAYGFNPHAMSSFRAVPKLPS